MDSLVERNRKLLKEGILSDVTFIVGKDERERIKAHKGILSTSSSVFYLIFTESTEDETEIPILDINPSSFRTLLEFVYTEEDPKFDSDNWAPLLYAAETFRLPSLRKLCKSFAERSIGTINPFKLLSEARKYGVHHHVPFLKDIIAFYAEKSLTSDSILDIQDTESLGEILSYDKLNCDEIVVFRAAMRWASAQIHEDNSTSIRQVLGKAFYSIRFPRISPTEFRNEVLPSDVLTEVEIIDILKKRKGSFPTNSRIRICNRFSRVSSSILGTKHHAIKFRVDNPVNIHGFSINIPHDENNESLCGKIILKEEGGKILGDNPFNIYFNKVFSTTIVHFKESPVCVSANKWYIASVDFDIDTNLTIERGINGRSSVTIDEVEWTFDNASSSAETNVFKGQIPAIAFSRVI